jgi:hypothetical protein
MSANATPARPKGLVCVRCRRANKLGNGACRLLRLEHLNANGTLDADRSFDPASLVATRATRVSKRDTN